MGRIGSGVRVSAGFQKKPAGFCPRSAKGGYDLGGGFVWGLTSDEVCVGVCVLVSLEMIKHLRV